MSSSDPKRPPRAPPEPGSAPAPDEDAADETPSFDDLPPLRADDPRPQHVPQLPPGVRLARRRGAPAARRDEALPPAADALGQPEAAGPSAFVYVERGPGAGQLAPLPVGTTRIGRASASDLRLQHPSISRKHAQVEHVDGRLRVRDLGSQNGTSVNGRRLGKEAVEVHGGDVVTLGHAVLRVRAPGGPARPTPVPVPAEELALQTLPLVRPGVRAWAWGIATLALALGLGLVLWLR